MRSAEKTSTAKRAKQRQRDFDSDKQVSFADRVKVREYTGKKKRVRSAGGNRAGRGIRHAGGQNFLASSMAPSAIPQQETSCFAGQSPTGFDETRAHQRSTIDHEAARMSPLRQQSRSPMGRYEEPHISEPQVIA